MMAIDALLVPPEVVAHEVYAQLSTPLLRRFLREMPARGDNTVGEYVVFGRHLPASWIWRRLTRHPA